MREEEPIKIRRPAKVSTLRSGILATALLVASGLGAQYGWAVFLYSTAGLFLLDTAWIWIRNR